MGIVWKSGINGWERDERWEYWIGINCYAVLGREN